MANIIANELVNLFSFKTKAGSLAEAQKVQKSIEGIAKASKNATDKINRVSPSFGKKARTQQTDSKIIAESLGSEKLKVFQEAALIAAASASNLSDSLKKLGKTQKSNLPISKRTNESMAEISRSAALATAKFGALTFGIDIFADRIASRLVQTKILAQNVNVGTTALQAFQGAAILGGSSASALNSALQTLTTQGFSTKPLKELLVLSKQFQQFSAIRAQQAGAQFGLSPQLINLMRSGKFSEFVNQVKATGGIATPSQIGASQKFFRSFQLLKLTLDGLANTVSSALFPSLEKMNALFAKFILNSKALIGLGVGEFFKGVAASFSVIGAVGSTLISILKSIGFEMNSLSGGAASGSAKFLAMAAGFAVGTSVLLKFSRVALKVAGFVTGFRRLLPVLGEVAEGGEAVGVSFLGLNPVSAVIIGIGAAVVGVITIFKNWDAIIKKLSETFPSLAKKIKAEFPDVTKGIGKITTDISSKFTPKRKSELKRIGEDILGIFDPRTIDPLLRKSVKSSGFATLAAIRHPSLVAGATNSRESNFHFTQHFTATDNPVETGREVVRAFLSAGFGKALNATGDLAATHS